MDENRIRRLSLITDGRFSGSNRGLFVGHISPEAVEGGELALVQNGDEISIDIPARTLTLHVSETELIQRRKTWQPLDYTKEFLQLAPQASVLNGYAGPYMLPMLAA